MKTISFNQDLTDVNFDFNFNNFNPDDIDTDETINAVFITDTSGSVDRYVNELNSAFNDFTESMQKSHIAPRLFVSLIEFNDKPTVVGGFRPVTSIPKTDFSKRLGGYTALYDAVKLGIENAVLYRKNLENSGIECKTLIFIITDGDDNNSSHSSHEVKILLQKIKSDERSAFTFNSILFGVGEQANFEKAKNEMGIDYLAKVGTSGNDMKRMIGFISQSISSVSAGQSPFTSLF